MPSVNVGKAAELKDGDYRIVAIDRFEVGIFNEGGKLVALLGPSGCGKSTCVQLLQRFYNLHSGEMVRISNCKLIHADTQWKGNAMKNELH